MDIKHIADIRPSKRQLKWQQLEFYGFIHFGINTFADREWGLGTESPSPFNPTELGMRCSGCERLLLRACGD